MIGDVAALAAGVLLGAGYFGSIWWTVRRVPEARRPALLLLGGYTVRFVLLGAALYGLLVTGVSHLLLALVGIVLARHLLIRRFGRLSSRDVGPRDEVSSTAGGGPWS